MILEFVHELAPRSRASLFGGKVEDMPKIMDSLTHLAVGTATPNFDIIGEKEMAQRVVANFF